MTYDLYCLWSSQSIDYQVNENVVCCKLYISVWQDICYDHKRIIYYIKYMISNHHIRFCVYFLIVDTLVTALESTSVLA